MSVIRASRRSLRARSGGSHPTTTVPTPLSGGKREGVGTDTTKNLQPKIFLSFTRVPHSHRFNFSLSSTDPSQRGNRKRTSRSDGRRTGDPSSPHPGVSSPHVSCSVPRHVLGLPRRRHSGPSKNRFAPRRVKAFRGSSSTRGWTVR